MRYITCECLCVEVNYMGIDGREVYIFGGYPWKPSEGRLFRVIKRWTKSN